MSVEVVEMRGWPVLRISSAELQVDVLPGKGGDILSVVWLATGTDVLWKTPWGLRERGAVPTAAGSTTAFLESYPGGWQTLFPNGGDASSEQGAELGFHGEATLIPWQWRQLDEQAIELTTVLVRSPFALRREVRVAGGEVTVTEWIRNASRTPQSAMWSHHPAFGAPFLDPGCRVESAATSFLADAGYDTEHGDLQPGAASPWPHAAAKDGGLVDLRAVPAPDAGVDRYGYLLDFTEPWYRITNDTLDLAVDVRWDGATFPYAWLWCEASGSAGFPWHQRAYVLAIEPASSHPGSGLAVAREHGTAICFEPGEERTAFVRMHLGAAS